MKMVRKVSVEGCIVARINSVTCNDNLELPGIPPLPKKRGRRSSGKALTAAQRQAKFRSARSSLTVLVSPEIKGRLDAFMIGRDETLDQVVERALKQFFRSR